MDSPSEIHLTIGDLNSYTGVEQESHILPEEARNIPRRKGDPHPDHQPVTNLSDDTITLSVKARGRLLLLYINTTSQLTANGRFESSQQPIFPATLIRTRVTDSSTLISRTIVDYMIIGKNHWDTVRRCTVHSGSHLQIGYSPLNPTLKPCDRELLTLSIEMPGSLTHLDDHPAQYPDRLQFRTEKLKHEATLSQFRDRVESASTSTLIKMNGILAQYQAGTIDKESLTNNLHAAFTQNIFYSEWPRTSLEKELPPTTLGRPRQHPDRYF